MMEFTRTKTIVSFMGKALSEQYCGDASGLAFWPGMTVEEMEFLYRCPGCRVYFTMECFRLKITNRAIFRAEWLKQERLLEAEKEKE